MAETLERHPCLRVKVIVNGVGLLRELHAAVPTFTIPAASWLLLVRHAGECAPVLYGDSEDERLLDAVFSAMRRHGLHTLSADTNDETLDAVEADDPDWRCPDHELDHETAMSALAAAVVDEVA